MEDRRDVRISSQHVAVLRTVSSTEQVNTALGIWRVVDQQNAGDPTYKHLAQDPIATSPSGRLRFDFQGREQPNGYTEGIFGRRRIEGRRKCRACDLAPTTKTEDRRYWSRGAVRTAVGALRNRKRRCPRGSALTTVTRTSTESACTGSDACCSGGKPRSGTALRRFSSPRARQRRI